MNQSFNLRRWFLLVREHGSRNGKRYWLSLLAIGGIMVGFYSFFILAGQNAIPLNIQSASYFFGLFFSGCLFGSMLFDDLNNTPKAISALLLPASHLEKLLCRLFFGIVVFFISYTLIYYLVNIPMVNLSNNLGAGWHKLGREANLPFKRSGIENVFSTRQEMQPLPFPFKLNPYLFEAFFVAQSAFILGSVYFRKFSFIKTAICLFALFFLLFIYFGVVLSKMTPDGCWYDSLTSWHINQNNISGHVLLPGWADRIFYFLIGYPFAFIFLTVTYFRLKEKEI